LGFHLVNWDLNTKPKSLGGWGIQNLDWFPKAFVAKSLWRALLRPSLWSLALLKKYIKGADGIYWLRTKNHIYHDASLF